MYQVSYENCDNNVMAGFKSQTAEQQNEWDMGGNLGRNVMTVKISANSQTICAYYLLCLRLVPKFYLNNLIFVI